ncbi:MAG: PIN domain-containing protein [Jannaschia sp.]
MRIVLDTNILVSALLVGSSAGTAPRRVLRLCLEGGAVPLMGAALYAEYEDVLARDELFARSPLSSVERGAVFDALMSVCLWTPVYYLWRPNLPDAGDDHLVELALAGGADWIVTANVRDLDRGELRFDQLAIGTAGDFLDRRDAAEQETTS